MKISRRPASTLTLAPSSGSSRPRGHYTARRPARGASNMKEPRLAPPGAGVPALERFVGKHLLLPRLCRRLSWDDAPALLERQGIELLELAGGRSEARLTERVLVPRQRGLEDSSRFHSFAMVIEHLTIVGRRTTGIVRDLTHGRLPHDPVRTAELKPSGALSLAATVCDYRAMLVEFREAALEQTADRTSSLRFPHPWFGPLSAHTWLCFAPFHQTIHLEQARRIVRLG